MTITFVDRRELVLRVLVATLLFTVAALVR